MLCLLAATFSATVQEIKTNRRSILLPVFRYKVVWCRDTSKSHKMSVICHSCTGDASESHVKCRGFCTATFHPSCTGMSSDAFEHVMKNHQVFWFCPSCTTLMKDTRFRNTVKAAHDAGQQQALNSHGDILENLKTEILNELKSEIRNNFATLINSNSLTPMASQRIGVERRFSKKRRLLSVNNNTPSVSRPTLLQGSGSSVSPSLEIRTVPKNQPKFYLYLSRIAPDVSVEQVAALAKKRLDADDVQVTRLVAKGRDVSTLSFVSFKVGMNVELKPRALSTSTWPKGILFREFSGDSSSANFWRPKSSPAIHDPLEFPTVEEAIMIE